jgi:hypothetical protein
LEQLTRDPNGVLGWWSDREETLAPGSGQTWDTDVFWHVLHFVLNGELNGGSKPLWDAVLGGTCFSSQNVILEDKPGHFIANLDTLWETARYLTPRETLEVAQALESFDLKLFRQRFDVARFNHLGLYRAELFDPHNEEQEFSETFMPRMSALKEWYRLAADSNNAMLIRMG